MGRNTMQMQRVETSAGTAIWAAPVEDGLAQIPPLLEVALDVLDGHGGVVHQDAHREGETAQGHDVDGLAAGSSG